MARIRSIKPDFFKSLTIGGLSYTARLTFIGLWCYVDDNGVGRSDVRLIRSEVWPLDEAPEILRRTQEDLSELCRAGLITLYEADGRALLSVSGWREHQKISHPAKPRYPRPEDLPEPPKPGPDLGSPEPPEGSGNPPEPLRKAPEILPPDQGAGSREQGAGIERAGAGASSPPQTQPADSDRPNGRTTIPDDFALNGAMRKWAISEFGNALDPDFQTEQFISHYRAEGTKRSNWYEAWKKWMRQAAEWQSKNSRRGADIVPLHGKTSRAAAFADGMDEIAEQLRHMNGGTA